MAAYDKLIAFIRDLYDREGWIPLHEPCFSGKEKDFLLACMDSTFVSTTGAWVDRVEQQLTEITGAGHAVATVNGTAALHIALLAAGVCPGDEVVTQPLTFVATCNAIRYCGAAPLFIDVDRDTLGLSPEKLVAFLDEHTERSELGCVNKRTGNIIRACVPMHTFGHPARVDQIVAACADRNIIVVEDAAESLGSRYRDKHTGTFGTLSALSFNGNKIVTAGGGGAVLTHDGALAEKIRHLITTAKAQHEYELLHDAVGYNYRMPNLNAALLSAQLERLNDFLADKRETARLYRNFCAETGLAFVDEPPNGQSNFWLNTIVVADESERNDLLRSCNDHAIMARPCWRLMHRLPMFEMCETGDLTNALWLAGRLVNLPSSVRKYSSDFVRQ